MSPAIDDGQVRHFWESQGRKLGSVPLESIANLEERKELLEEKMELEQKCILPLLAARPDFSVLDLGAGVGQWTVRLAPRVRRVVAVEYTDSIAAIGREEARRQGLANVEFVTAAAENFETAESFDVIFISGLLLYLNDAAARKLLARLAGWLKSDGRVVVRDAVSVLPGRHVLVNRYSALLRAHYSALYRTGAEIQGLFAAAGLRCEQSGQVFPEGSALNKFPETRLKYFLFRPS
jgi:SAM-dependent methyltransferase